MKKTNLTKFWREKSWKWLILTLQTWSQPDHKIRQSCLQYCILAKLASLCTLRWTKIIVPFYIKTALMNLEQYPTAKLPPFTSIGQALCPLYNITMPLTSRRTCLEDWMPTVALARVHLDGLLTSNLFIRFVTFEISTASPVTIRSLHGFAICGERIDLDPQYACIVMHMLFDAASVVGL